MAFDIKDILNVPSGNSETPVLEKKKRLKKPRGMCRELWGLLWKDDLTEAPIVPSDTSDGYKQMKAKIGISKVRPWKWMPFTNPARTDGMILYHWRREADEGKEYAFASFNKTSEIPMYSDIEYQQHLHSDTWTRSDTDHLFELCKLFALRFVIVHDRWGRDKFKDRSLEDIKERFYTVSNTLTKIRAGAGGEAPKPKVFDAEHEKKRKEQLVSMYHRSRKEVEEEQALLAELKKIESRKKERERKTQDLQNLISAADSGIGGPRKLERKGFKRKRFQAAVAKQPRDFSAPTEGTAIKFPELKPVGVSLRSTRMKLPATLGQKKAKAIEQVLEELSLDAGPLPTKEISQGFNDLRQDIVLLYELKMALTGCQMEAQSLRHQLETLAPGRSFPVAAVKEEPGALRISASINVLNQNRKRKAAMEQSNVLKKIRHKHSTVS